MHQTIRESLQKIKSVGGRLSAEPEVFPAVLIVLVGVVSFGLGRISVPSDGVGDTIERYTFSTGSDALAGPPVPAAQAGAATGALPAPDTDMVSAQEASTGERKYVASKNGTKYHLPWCSGAARIMEANKIWFSSKAEAEAAGYTPAANCKGI